MHNWQDAALCREVGPDAFDPPPDGNVAVARRICNRCEVREPCLEAALGHGRTLAGTWAGTTQDDRATIRRRRKAARAA